MALGFRDGQIGIVEAEDDGRRRIQIDAIRVAESIEKRSPENEDECPPHYIPAKVLDVREPNRRASANDHNHSGATRYDRVPVAPHDSYGLWNGYAQLPQHRFHSDLRFV